MIMTDMECVSGLTCADYMDRSNPLWQDTRASLTGDVNAAAEGCFQAGAGEVAIRLGHGPDTLLLDELDPRVTIAGEKSDNFSGLDDSFDAAMMVGQHAKAGTIDAFLDHTQSSVSIFEHTINGISLGEIGQWALQTGHFNIPVIFLAGDDAACREAQELLPGIRIVSVGTGCGRQHMAPRNQVQVWKDISAGAETALKNRDDWPAVYKLDPPYTVRITVFRADMADKMCRLRSDRKRIDARTIEMVVDSPLKILNIFV